MESIIIVVAVVVIITTTVFILKQKKSKAGNSVTEITNPQEIDVLPKDEIPIQPSEIIIPAEMPEKPLPINCQLAQFQPAPQDFFYVDCCGVPHKGQGFEPWEKRAPVAIDANKGFFGMTLLDSEAEINC